VTICVVTIVCVGKILLWACFKRILQTGLRVYGSCVLRYSSYVLRRANTYMYCIRLETYKMHRIRLQTYETYLIRLKTYEMRLIRLNTFEQ